MRTIEILDCTLRDGGYVNDNHFGYENIKQLIKYLERAKIDLIECGYLMDEKENYSFDRSEYRRMEELEEQQLIPSKKKFQYTLMLLGEKYHIERLPLCSDSSYILRMSFHKKSLPKAMEYAKEITKKGYRLFLQPTVIMGYTDEEIKEMIRVCNEELNLEGLAIVDTFGQMKPQDIIKLTKLFDQNLNSSVKLAFHSHNNLQMAFANAIAFIESSSQSRNIVIDSSIYGMGRGAGNLPTELIANYLNEKEGKNYSLSALLEAADNILEKIKKEHPWGYSLPYYLSAIYACHPSYILYLLNKKTLDNKDIHEIVQMISNQKRTEYDKEYIAELYQVYNNHDYDDKSSYQKLEKMIGQKKVLLIGPGKSILNYREKIAEYQQSHPCFTIVINNPNLYSHDAVFYSNRKRHQETKDFLEEKDIKLLTSNITTEKDENTLIFDYNRSLSRNGEVSDSALLVCLNILTKMKVKEIVLAGFDGFVSDFENNFYQTDIAYLLDKNYIDQLNTTMKENIKEYQKKVYIKTLTPSKNL